MVDLTFLSVIDAFSKIGAVRPDGSKYGGIRGVSVSGDGRRFRFWEHELVSNESSGVEIRRDASRSPRWVTSPHGQTFYARLGEAMQNGIPVYVVVNKRGADDNNGNWTATSAAPILRADGQPAAGKVVKVDARTGEVRIVFDIGLTSKKSRSQFEEKLIVDQFDVQVRRATRTSEVYSRDEKVRRAALRRSKGLCERPSCRLPGFATDYGVYLETHHVIPLSEGGGDSTKNVVALCPTCHRMAHCSKDRDAIRRELLSATVNM